MSLYKLPTIELSGTPRQMGESLGERYREQIQNLCELHYQWTLDLTKQAAKFYDEEQLFSIMSHCVKQIELFCSDSYEEFCAIARGANITPEYLFLSQMSDVIDILIFGTTSHSFGCSSVIVCPDRTKESNILVGQTWDWLTEDMPFFALFHRKPKNGIEHWALGLLCGNSMGMNVDGVAIGSTNLMTWDARPGVARSVYISKILGTKRSSQQALEMLENVSRASAHYSYLADSTGIGYGVESAVRKSAITEHKSGFFVHCNHALDKEIKKYEDCAPDESTCFRQERLTQLLKKNNKVSVSDIKQYFSDRVGGELGVRQENTLGIYSTDACAIFSPQTREIHACRGPADLGEWITVTL